MPAAAAAGPVLAADGAPQRTACEARGAALNSGPVVEVFAPPLRPSRHASFTAAAPSGRAHGAGNGSGTRTSPGSEGKASRPPRLSAEENSVGGLLANSAGKLLPSSTKFVAPRQPAGHDPALPLSMMAVAAHAGFLAVALQGCAKQCGQLRASRQLFREVAGAVKRGDLQGAVRRLKEAGGRWWGRAARRGGASLPACLLSAPPSACPPPGPTPAADLSVTARVIESGALQAHRNADRFSIELCAEAAALCGALLASSAAVHQQAALQLLESILSRWGEYVWSVLNPLPRITKVDLALEGRQTRSRALRAALQALVPPLEKLAAHSLGGGRAQQALVCVRAL